MQLQNCVSPRIVFNKNTGQTLVVPCGHCPNCLSLKQKTWVDRLSLESNLHKYTLFFTLTYDNEHVPVASISSTEAFDVYDFFADNYSKEVASSALRSLGSSDLLVVSKSDVQKFIKRLRFKIEKLYGSKVRYYITSEYGPTTNRPHYHGLLFFDDSRISKNSFSLLFEAWQNGFVNCSPARHGAGEYCAKYINSISHCPPVCLYPDWRPFSLYSKQPSLGSFEIGDEKFTRFLFGEDTSLLVTAANGIKDVSVWRSFENRIFPRPSGIGSLPYKLRTSHLRLSTFSRCLKFRIEKQPPKNQTELNSLIQDYYKFKRINDICQFYGIDVGTYSYFWDLYYYRKAQSCLNSFYSFQESFTDDCRYLINLYPEEYVKIKKSLYHDKQLDKCYFAFLKGFGFHVYEPLSSDFVLGASILLSELYEFDASKNPQFKKFLEMPKRIYKHSYNLRVLNEKYLFK